MTGVWWGVWISGKNLSRQTVTRKTIGHGIALLWQAEHIEKWQKAVEWLVLWRILEWVDPDASRTNLCFCATVSERESRLSFVTRVCRSCSSLLFLKKIRKKKTSKQAEGSLLSDDALSGSQFYSDSCWTFLFQVAFSGEKAQLPLPLSLAVFLQISFLQKVTEVEVWHSVVPRGATLCFL